MVPVLSRRLNGPLTRKPTRMTKDSEPSKSDFTKKALDRYREEYEDSLITRCRRPDHDDELLRPTQTRKALGS